MKILLVLQIIVAAGILLTLLYPLVRKMVRLVRDVASMSRIQAPTGEVAPGVLSIRDANVNLYLVRCDSGWFAIDAGVKAARVERALHALNVPPVDVRAVFVTHSDMDHVGGLSAFPKAVVYLSRDEKPLIDGKQKRVMLHGRVKMRNRIAAECSFVQDGDTVEVCGRSVRCLHTPGHTPGSMTYIVDDTLMFVGDTGSFVDGRLVPFLDWVSMDGDQNDSSLRRLVAETRELPLTHIFTGHHGWSNDPSAALSGI